MARDVTAILREFGLSSCYECGLLNWQSRQMKQLILTALIALLCVARGADAAVITAKGSDSMVILAQKWAEVYMGKNRHSQIQVTGGGSGTGFAALQNRTTDLCNASRPIKAKETLACIRAFGRRPQEFKVCLDGLTVYVNPKNPISELSLIQVSKIFRGQVTNWKEVGGSDSPIVVYGRENSSGTYEFFKKRVLLGRDFAASVQSMPGTAAVLQAVTRDEAGIGYGGAAYGSAGKALKIRVREGEPAISPNRENVTEGIYPISRFMYIYVNPALVKGEIGDYLKWIQSDVGQKVVAEVGYYPMPNESRVASGGGGN